MGTILEALMFVEHIQRSDGAPYLSFCQINDGWLTATNGVLTIGHKVDTSLSANPNTKKLLTAITKCGDSYTMEATPAGRLSVRSERMRALVPCCTEKMFSNSPDKNCGLIGEGVIKAFRTLAPFIKDSHQSFVMSSVFVRPNSCVATNGRLLIDYKHDYDLPTVLVPRIFATTVASSGRVPTGYGSSQSSFTIHFDDDSWVKTQTYVGKYPQVDKMFDVAMELQQAPEFLVDGVLTATEFSEDGSVYIKDGQIRSSGKVDAAVKYDVGELKGDCHVGGKNLAQICGKITEIDCHSNQSKLFFIGEGFRGLMTKAV